MRRRKESIQSHINLVEGILYEKKGNINESQYEEAIKILLASVSEMHEKLDQDAGDLIEEKLYKVSGILAN